MKIEISREELSRRSLMIGTPAYGGQTTVPYTLSLLDTANRFRELQIPLKTCMLENESLITRARNNIVKMFWHDDSMKHLLFIDADIRFAPDDVLSLLALNDRYPIICGAYPKKTINWNNIHKAALSGVPAHELKNYLGEMVLNLIPNESGQIVINLDQPVEVLDSGTGFMMINKRVIADMIKAYPEMKYRADYQTGSPFTDNYVNEGIYAFFDTAMVPYAGGVFPGQKRYLSEDYYFCHLARQAGYKIHVLPSINLTHHGSHHYYGNLRAVLQLHNEPIKEEIINQVETV